jgi:hypothetical protein
LPLGNDLTEKQQGITKQKSRDKGLLEISPKRELFKGNLRFKDIFESGDQPGRNMIKKDTRE